MPAKAHQSTHQAKPTSHKTKKRNTAILSFFFRWSST